MNKIILVAQREFLTRVQKKTFLLTTIGVPLIIFAFYAAIIYFSIKTTDHFTVAVTDKGNIFNGKIDEKKSSEVIFTFVNDDTAALRTQLESGKFDAYLYVPATFSANSGDSLQFRSKKTVGLMTREKIQNRISKALEEKRLLSMNISKAQLDSIQEEKEYITFASTSGKTENQAKVGVSYAVGMISGFMIYIILFIYGAQVMRGVAEEKVNRIAEVIVSSVKPFQLMLGKITGIGAVGLVQFIIWAVLIFGIQLAVPLLFPGIAEQMQSQPIQPGAMGAANAVKQSGALNGLMAGLSEVNFPLIIGCFIFYFLGGYFTYAALFAAVGSATNEDPQDAQSLMLPIMMPIIFSIVIMMQAVNNPNGSIAVFGSLFPLTSPIVMMARIAHGIPDGVTVFQLILSMVFLVIGFMATTWMAAKIYRTGILMYGKKVSWKEMWKWAFKKG
ncbi:MAG: ABC transporter permease [Chitinophagaceae bacterium]|jgi:ABC-2 type transport system permease protein|nr:ABC transporter permease [Chitinophagaceae bacterium]